MVSPDYHAWEEGDVYSIVGNISVDHDMDGGAVTPDIILYDANNFRFDDTSVIGGTWSNVNATYKFLEITVIYITWTSPGNPHSYTVTAADVLNTEFITVHEWVGIC